MRFIEENKAIREVAEKIKSWPYGASGNPYGVRNAGGWFEYWMVINQRGNFKLGDGRIVVLDEPELKMALDIAESTTSEQGIQGA